jgi:hypothetical protein
MQERALGGESGKVERWDKMHDTMAPAADVCELQPPNDSVMALERQQ